MLYHGIYNLSETTMKPQERKVLKFDVDLNTIHHYKTKGFKIDVDVIGPRIICNRPKESQSEYSVEYLKQLLDAALQVMSNIGRLHDFVSLLEAIGKGLLSNNVAIHLCLDIGALRRVKALSTKSYPKISMDWWLTVKIVLKGKALELFEGIWELV